jgi:xylose isomerase
MKTYQEIPAVPYEGPSSTEPFSFKYYNPDEVLAGKPMREHLRFALSWWHTLCAEGADMFGGGTMDKSFGKQAPMDIFKAKADFGFALMDKLQIDYYCFHDVDIAPEGGTWRESLDHFNEMVDYLAQLQARHGKKLLWNTANNFGDRKFMAGAATSCSADVYAVAAAKVKAGLDAAKKLRGQGYVFWGGREGYETLLNTDMKLELDNLAHFMRMAVDYKKEIGFEGDFYIEPKPKEPTKHQYDFDAATCMNFLRAYGLEKEFKLNIEANHATLAGHTFQHEIRTAAINGAFGSIDANQGDPFLGWDTDQFPTNIYDTTLAMYEILKAGGFTRGGLNFDAKARRMSNTLEDILLCYIAGMDAFALGLRKALAMIEDGRIDRFVHERYRSYRSGVGARIAAGETSLRELSDYALTVKDFSVESGRQEYLESVLNNILFC